MLNQRLQDELRGVSRRYRRLFAWSACALVWLAIAAVGAVLLELASRREQGSSWWVALLAVAALLLTAVACGWVLRRTRDDRWIARRIEAKHPDLNSLLLTAVEQKPASKGGHLGFLQTRVVRDALLHAHRTDWRRDVPTRRLLAGQLVGLASLGLMLVVLDRLATQVAQANRDAPTAFRAAEPAESLSFEVSVSPGDAEIERGTSLVVTARFATRRPDEAVLVVTDPGGEMLRTPMSLSLSDPVFGARVADVQTDLTYRVEFDQQLTRDFQVTVYEHPQLIRADADLTFPSYTGLPEKRVEDIRRVTAVEGTVASLQCNLNKPVRSALLVPETGDPLVLQASADDPTRFEVSVTMRESMRYELVLEDDDGRTNKSPDQITLNVTPNQRPDVKLAEPARDVRVSPIEELQTRASVWDDFGLQAYGVHYTLPGQEPRDVILGQTDQRNQREQVDHLIAFEDLRAEPDQLLAYYFWAEDIGPDGQARRTLGDMFFAEVRHFEEIFREGEQPPGGQSAQQQQQQQQQQGGQNAEQAEQLAELQKQIINANWTVIRRETESEPTAEFASDVEELQAAQSDALEQLAQLTENLEDRESLEYAKDVERHMLTSMTRLMTAEESSSPSPLPEALAAEQAAYQALLKLRAREFSVTQSQQPSQQQQQSAGSASGPQSRAQQQLEQLELDSSENRYETESQAAQTQAQEQEQRENLQVLNRLRELARRQEDVNRRMKELQSALEEAEDEAEREQIREQLKRLREQEQQMLRDMDELAERMDQPENQERMSESREQLEQTRENIRQTTEALQEGQVSRAVASGSRAQEQLESMREEFRQATADGFQAEAEELRNAARELDRNERELADRLRQSEPEPDQPPALRREDNREALREAFDEQREALERLLESMQETVEQAEEAEPLMAGQLYDAIREARQQRVDDALDATSQLLDRGLLDQAELAESQAARGIEALRQGVEQAAESVLASEEESLRRAQRTLEELARQLDEELRREAGQAEDPQASSSRDGQSPEPGEREPGDREPGQPGSGQPGGGQTPSESPDPSEAGEPREPSPNGQGGRTPQQGEPDSQQRQQDRQDQPSEGQPQNGPPSGQPGSGQGTPPSPGQSPPSETGQSSPGETPGDAAARPQTGGQQPSGNRQPDGGGRQTAAGPSSIEMLRGPSGPITGEFLPWSDRLRDVEEMLEDPELRSDVARVREAARDIRREMHRDFQGPNWDVVRELVAEPLNEVRDRLADELLRLESTDAMVPIDRDPVPERFADPVRRYYERLGSGQ